MQTGQTGSLAGQSLDSRPPLIADHSLNKRATPSIRGGAVDQADEQNQMCERKQRSQPNGAWNVDKQ